MTKKSPSVFRNTLLQRMDGPKNPLAQAWELLADRQLVSLSGLCRQAACFYLPLMVDGPLVLLTDEESSCETWAKSFRESLPMLGFETEDVLVFPAPDVDLYHGLPMHPGRDQARAMGLLRLARGQFKVALLPVKSALLKVPRMESLERRLLKVQQGDEIGRDPLVEQLWEAGFRRVDFVAEDGEFSVRGGIVDVAMPNELYPTRVEWFGDQVDEMRFFEPTSQRSLHHRQDPLLIAPLKEVPRDVELLEAWEQVLDEAGDERLDLLRQKGTYAGMELEVRALESRFGSLGEYLNQFPLAVPDPSMVEASGERHHTHGRLGFEHAGRHDCVAPERLLTDQDTLLRWVASADLHLQGEATNLRKDIRFSTSPGPVFAGRLAEGMSALKGTATTLVAHTSVGMGERMLKLFLDEDINAAKLTPEEPAKSETVSLTPGSLERGFVDPDLDLWLVAQADLFGRSGAVGGTGHLRRTFRGDLRDLKPGGLVVHVEHGIGQYMGLEVMDRNGSREEFLVLAYKGGSKLFVPVERMDLVQAYGGHDGEHTEVERLGGEGWTKKKSKARKSAHHKAAELLELYAKRKLARGHAFAPDTEWQSQFEGQFPYPLTRDQEAAVVDLKQDMEAPRPMDRLVCGDVGFGKTEVAMRAVFKACVEGFQAAVLCPTTILAHQHEKNFRQRFAGFPMRIEALYRFKSKEQIKETLAALEAGEVDLVIGTHRILSKDVKFSNLGLLVIDEEQRFGVRHKERLKALRTHVDVLSLSATPIPRTLQMSLSGIRDMSVIETAPRDRLSIQTHVMPWQDAWVADAVHREMDRQGQVFIIHNTVETLENMTARIRAAAPTARILAAHGQMDSGLLEKTMLKFVNHEADVLVATTILENGIDMPNVNTMVVNRADRFGLSQLYQLRGRIGRSDRQAYCFLSVPADRTLTEDARRRLEALRDFSDLGAGFRIAALDLEIRGAGALLGTAQSGHLAAVGFDLYMRMLEEEIAGLSGDQIVQLPPTEIQLGLDLEVPKAYIPVEGARLRLYKRMSLARDLDGIKEQALECKDTFGPIPDHLVSLFRVAALRLASRHLGLAAVRRLGDEVHLKLDRASPLAPEDIVRVLQHEPEARLTQQSVLVLPLKGVLPDALSCAWEAINLLGDRNDPWPV